MQYYTKHCQTKHNSNKKKMPEKDLTTRYWDIFETKESILKLKLTIGCIFQHQKKVDGHFKYKVQD